MSEVNDKYLDAFPKWLRSLGDDVEVAAKAVESDKLDTEARRYLIGGINYLFKSLDLIPDGIDDIGYLDDAFVLRLAAKTALDCEIGAIDPEILRKLGKMANDSELIEEFLGDSLFDRFDTYVRHLSKGASRGRTVDELIENPLVFREFLAEARTFIKEYNSPGFANDAKNLIKLKAFFDAKLPK
jgi:uncharacterized membrane protein YkvA (DUF1232 family)